MKKIILHTTLLILLHVGLAAAVTAWDGMTAMESQLYDQLIAARNNPAQALEDLGIDPDDLVQCHPTLAPYIDTGLPVVAPDQRLFDSASGHAEDMAKNGYFTKVSLDGSTPVDRMKEAGYYAEKGDEALGVLLFRNYITKNDAVQALYKSMIENELKCDAESEPIIFNPDFMDIGVSIKAGSMNLNGVKLNFYLAVVDLGKEIINRDDKDLFLDLNMIRQKTIPSLYPFGMNMELYLQSRERAQQMIEDIELSELNQVYHNQDVLILSDTPVFGAQSAKIWVTTEPKEIDEARDYLVASLLETEELTVDPEQKVLLSDIYDYCGAVFMNSVPVLVGGSHEYYAHILVMTVGQSPANTGKHSVFGVLYTDADQDGQYTSGEGFSHGYIRIEPEDDDAAAGEMILVTEANGMFSCLLESGSYALTNADPQNQIGFIEKSFRVDNRNVWIFQECEKAEKQP